MKASVQEKQALVSLLTRIYSEIAEIEAAYQIMMDEGDYRPRIDYFHDAVRALTSGSDDLYAKHSRLSVEYLAYDISMLRHITAMPLARVRTALKSQPSPRKEVAMSGNPARAGLPPAPDREVKNKLMDLYKNYGVIFAALFAEAADRNHQSRTDDLNQDVEDMAMVEQAIKLMQQGKEASMDIEQMAQHIDNPVLHQLLMALLHHKGQKKRQAMEDSLKKIKDIMQGADKEIASIESAHFTFATSQLAVYEESKEVVKKIFASGMNLAGQFVQNSMTQAARNQSRGR